MLLVVCCSPTPTAAVDTRTDDFFRWLKDNGAELTEHVDLHVFPSGVRGVSKSCTYPGFATLSTEALSTLGAAR